MSDAAPIVSKAIRVRYPDDFIVGPGAIVDDFSYFSTRVEIGQYSHIASGCTIAGGRDHLFRLGAFSSVSAGVRIWCSSNDYVNDLVFITPNGISDADLAIRPIEGDVRIGDYTGIGANAVIMPGNEIPDGTVVGALSFVPAGFAFDPWTVYAGIPLRRLGSRNRDRVLRQVEVVTRMLEIAPQ